MAYKGKGRGKALGDGVFTGKSKESLDDAIRAAVSSIPVQRARTRKTFVVTSITVDVVGDPNVGAYSVTVS